MQHNWWVKSLQSIPAVYSKHIEDMAIDLLESTFIMADRMKNNDDALTYYIERIKEECEDRKKQQWEGVDY